LNQDYSNYRIIVIDDASTDNTIKSIEIFLRQKKVPMSKYVVIRNKKQMFTVSNIYLNIKNHCDFEDIAVIMNGGD
jgi:glycosyltransferase involved in cell wall biosynthesis